jgi:hypothetical protein
MLLQNLDLNSESNMFSSGDEFDSKKYFSETDSKTNTDLSVSPFSNGPFSTNNGPFSNNSTNYRTIPALPNLTAPSSSTSWSSSSAGTYSLFSTTVSSSSHGDKNLLSDSKPFHLNAVTNLNSQSQTRPINLLPSNKSYHAAPNPTNMDIPHSSMTAMQRASDPLETVLGPFPCVRMRGLPFDTNLEDVLVFFQGLMVLDVVVVSNSYNQPGYSGEAFVVFGNPIDFQMALQR